MERQFGKRDGKELDKAVICWEDREIIRVLRRREEIRIVVLKEKAHVKRAQSGEEAGGNHIHYRAVDRVEERKALGRRAGRAELRSSRGAMEPHPTAVRTYYQKQNNSELGALPWLLSTELMSHWAKGITITSNVNYITDLLKVWQKSSVFLQQVLYFHLIAYRSKSLSLDECHFAPCICLSCWDRASWTAFGLFV